MHTFVSQMGFPRAYGHAEFLKKYGCYFPLLDDIVSEKDKCIRLMHTLGCLAIPVLSGANESVSKLDTERTPNWTGSIKNPPDVKTLQETPNPDITDRFFFVGNKSVLLQMQMERLLLKFATQRRAVLVRSLRTR